MRSIIVCIFIILSYESFSQNHTVGFFLNSPESYNGYTLFAPIPSTETYLIDNCGKLVHSWSSEYKPAMSTYLLEDGMLLRTGKIPNTSFGNTGGAGGIIQQINWDGDVLWEYIINGEDYLQHHDIEPLPNGNIFAIAWERYTNAKAIEAGRDPGKVRDFLWSEKIIEIKPGEDNLGEIVWEWRVWDHLIQEFDESKSNYGIVADHPELIDLNYLKGPRVRNDWLHINSVDYNPEFDQIILSVHNFNEIWVIDHSTSKEQAAGHEGGNSGKGGDLLYRWGNPETYGRGGDNNQMLFAQHDARWIEPARPEEGKIMIFNNGLNRPGGNHSTVDVIDPPVDTEGLYSIEEGKAFLPNEYFWTYKAPNPGEFFSGNISGADRLPNGNTLICEGASGHFFEVDPDGIIVWEYVNPVSVGGPLNQGDIPGGHPPDGSPNTVFKITRYNENYPGFTGRNLESGEPIELNPFDYDCETYTHVNDQKSDNEISIYSNPTAEYIEIRLPRCATLSKCGTSEEIRIFNALGECVLETPFVRHLGDMGHLKRIDISHLPVGIYFFQIGNHSQKFMVVR